MQRLTSGIKPFLLLTLLCLALFLPGIGGIPPIDRDESRYAQASKQMLESDDFIRIQFQGESRAKKPAGIYWLQTASATLTGARDAIWSYRLPSVAGALIAVLLTFACGRALVGAQAALMAAALLASSILLVSEAHQAKTDAVQLAAIVAAQGVLGWLYTRRDRPISFSTAMLFWLAQGVGILIKGPIVPMISLLTIAALWAFDRRLGWLRGLRPLAGLLLVAAIVGPWVWAISHATQGQFIGTAVKTDLLPKLLGAQESHGAKPGYFLLLAIATLWPASLFVVPALPHIIARRHEPATRFLLAWILPNWLMFEAVPTKLPHYILPVYPALLLLTAAWLCDMQRPALRLWQKSFSLLWGVIGTALAAALVAAPIALKMPPLWDLAPLAALMLALNWTPCVLMLRQEPRRAALMAVLAATVSYGTVFAILLPRLTPLWNSSRIVAIVPPATPLVAAGYHEPSLVFLHGTATLLTDGGGAADFLRDTPGGVAAVEGSAEAAFTARLLQNDQSADKIGAVDGINYSNGRPAHISLWRLTR